MVFTGLAIKDFWQVDDKTIVFVADPTFGMNNVTILFYTYVYDTIDIDIDWYRHSGNILNFNVGASVDLDIPRSFWSRLAGKYGNIFYWKEKVTSPIDTSVQQLPLWVFAWLVKYGHNESIWLRIVGRWVSHRLIKGLIMGL